MVYFVPMSMRVGVDMWMMRVIYSVAFVDGNDRYGRRKGGYMSVRVLE